LFFDLLEPDVLDDVVDSCKDLHDAGSDPEESPLFDSFDFDGTQVDKESVGVVQEQNQAEQVFVKNEPFFQNKFNLFFLKMGFLKFLGTGENVIYSK
jgi:hypothetical protein